jgi:hypothetical protein
MGKSTNTSVKTSKPLKLSTATKDQNNAYLSTIKVVKPVSIKGYTTAI